jgi:hypothetical protein
MLATLNNVVLLYTFVKFINFIQFSVSIVGNLEKACEAVASYLMFYPADETMLSNKDYYLKLPKVEKGFFTPREVIVIPSTRHA